MIRIFPILLFSLCFGLVFAVEPHYYEGLRDEIKKNFARMLEVKGKDEEAFEKSRQALEVKVALFKQFYRSTALQNREIQANLEDLFKKDQISMEDLSKLKELVNEKEY